MFTGIVEGVGEVVAAEIDAGGARIAVRLGPVADRVKIGDSIAIDGCCLTVVALDGDIARFDVAPETLSKTVLGAVRVGSRLNLERSLKLGDRLDGHIVTGHVDGVARVVRFERRGIELDVDVELPVDARRYVVEKGSITLNGVSLTIARVLDRGFSVMLIPHTAAVTNLGALTVGAPLHYELDAIGKWVERLVLPYVSRSPA